MAAKDRVAGDQLLVIGQARGLGGRLGIWGALPGICVDGTRTFGKRRRSRVSMMGDKFVAQRGWFCQREGSAGPFPPTSVINW